MEKYIPELEGLRAILAWWVVIGHAANFSGYTGAGPTLWWMQVILRTGVPVHVFIILSGFVIFYMLDRGRAQSFRAFMRGRVFRIYPVYLVCLLAALALQPLLQPPLLQAPWLDAAQRAAHAARLQAVAESQWRHIGLHLTLLHGVVPDQWLPYSGQALLGPAWSLSLEWQFYLIAPALLLLWRRSLWCAAAVAAAILLLKAVLARGGLTFSFGAFLPVRFEYFLLGIATYFTFKRSAPVFRWTPWLQLGAGIGAAFAVMIFTGGLREHFFAVAVWLLAVGAVLARQRDWSWARPLARLLDSRPARYLGRISYPTYLVHVIVIDGVGALLLRWLPAGDRAQVFALVLPPALLGTLIASQWLHRYVEAPALCRSKAQRMPAQRAAAHSK